MMIANDDFWLTRTDSIAVVFRPLAGCDGDTFDLDEMVDECLYIIDKTRRTLSRTPRFFDMYIAKVMTDLNELLDGKHGTAIRDQLFALSAHSGHSFTDRATRVAVQEMCRDLTARCAYG